jgi:hypothetical protein
MYRVLLHDERLSGNTPDWKNTIAFDVSKDDAIDDVLAWVNGAFKLYGQVEDLAIMCHGYVSESHAGGHGLQFSQDGVFLSNIYKWRAINGLVNWIFLYACNVAEIDPSVAPAEGDGRQLCLQMAATTGANVVAPLRTQYYHKSWNPFRWNEIDFGDWEGPVYHFWPDGKVTDVTKLNLGPEAD